MLDKCGAFGACLYVCTGVLKACADEMFAVRRRVRVFGKELEGLLRGE